VPPPPAEQLATRIFLGPALRTQPDRRLVRLVREGYEAAFEEIVRRYRRPLDRFAAAIVGGRSEDVTQDAFSKALLALRGSDAEIELRPWLYRIVRNTALNDLRDRPPATEELAETLGGGPSAAVEAERREEMGELMRRLRALPEPQRAAIVMRELEGLSHEEIAAALGVSGGAARQAIYRARAALRDGFGMLVPLPVLRMLFDHGAEAAGGGAVAAAGAGTASAAGGGAGALGGIGAGGALKLGLATALIAGSVGAGVAIQHDHGGGSGPTEAAASALPGGGEATQSSGGGGESGQGEDPAAGASHGGGSDRGTGGGGASGRGPGSGPGHAHAANPGSGQDGSGASPGGPPPAAPAPGHDGPSRGGGPGGHHSGGDGSHEEDSGGTHSGDGHLGEHHSGAGDGTSGDSGHGGESSGGDGSGDHGGDGSGGSETTVTAEPAEPGGEPQPEEVEGSDSHGGESSGSGSSSGGGGEISP
jgi:RNA polymerase sigma factor (sigma-70 family)